VKRSALRDEIEQPTLVREIANRYDLLQRSARMSALVALPRVVGNREVQLVVDASVAVLDAEDRSLTGGALREPVQACGEARGGRLERLELVTGVAGP